MAVSTVLRRAMFRKEKHDDERANVVTPHTNPVGTIIERTKAPTNEAAIDAPAADEDGDMATRKAGPPCEDDQPLD